MLGTPYTDIYSKYCQWTFAMTTQLRIVGSVIVLVWSLPAFAQMGVGRISGSVRDPSGGAIPGASVVARNLNTGVETKTLTTETGDYSFASLPVGTYSLEAGHQG